MMCWAAPVPSAVAIDDRHPSIHGSAEQEAQAAATREQSVADYVSSSSTDDWMEL